jgi:hypothetical protein
MEVINHKDNKIKLINDVKIKMDKYKLAEEIIIYKEDYPSDVLCK